eukprot:m.20840 g.20840  ORF g.20840 m.20840 type:complete len:67 (-) comp5621_c0_seq1:1011-1211(-)
MHFVDESLLKHHHSIFAKTVQIALRNYPLIARAAYALSSEMSSKQRWCAGSVPDASTDAPRSAMDG